MGDSDVNQYLYRDGSFFDLAKHESLTVAQVSVLGTMMLLAHALPIEGAVAKLTGVSWRVTLALRIGGGLFSPS